MTRWFLLELRINLWFERLTSMIHAGADRALASSAGRQWTGVSCSVNDEISAGGPGGRDSTGSGCSFFDRRGGLVLVRGLRQGADLVPGGHDVSGPGPGCLGYAGAVGGRRGSAGPRRAGRRVLGSAWAKVPSRRAAGARPAGSRRSGRRPARRPRGQPRHAGIGPELGHGGHVSDTDRMRISREPRPRDAVRIASSG